MNEFEKRIREHFKFPTTFKITAANTLVEAKEEEILKLMIIVAEASKEFLNCLPGDYQHSLKQAIQFWKREIEVLKTSYEDKRPLISWMETTVKLLEWFQHWFKQRGRTYPLISDCTRCEDCDRNVHDFLVPDDVWKEVCGSNENIVLCYDCFCNRLDEKYRTKTRMKIQLDNAQKITTFKWIALEESEELKERIKELESRLRIHFKEELLKFKE